MLPAGGSAVLYVVGRVLLCGLFRLLFRLRVEGQGHVPASGGVLLVANHASYLDPPVVGCALNRPVRFMAKAELFEIPVLRWLIRKLGAFPVQRGGFDRRAVRRAIELLREGEVVCLFPEGTRTRTGSLLPFQRGAGLIALRAGVPVLPIGIVNTFKPFAGGRFLPRPIVVRIGKPIPLPTGEGDDREHSQRITQLMAEGVAALLEDGSR